MAKEPKNKAKPYKQVRVTIAQEKFISKLIEGKSQREAYLFAFARARKWKPTSVDVEASKLYNNPSIQQRYSERLQEIRAQEQASVQWTREQSIKTLRQIIDLNISELQRIAGAFDEEMDLLQKQLVAAEAVNNEKEVERIIMAMIARRKSKRVSATYNNGVILAVSELNKMQGFDESTLNLNGTVVFAGQGDLVD